MSNRATAYQRGLSAKQKGRLLESNPFARRLGRANERRASDWALGWHSGTARVLVSSDWQWPPLESFPSPPEGDYGVRCRGLRQLFRPVDPVEYEILLNEMRAGVAGSGIPHWAVVPYVILYEYCVGVGAVIGEPCEDDAPMWFGHPMKFLYSAIRLQPGGCGHWPELVVSAYGELVS